MIPYENKLSQFPPTQSYVDFGLEQVEAINQRYDAWIARQSFAEDAVPSRFERMVVEGSSEQHDFHLKPSVDHVTWDLRFPQKVKIKDLDNALLHEHRLPEMTTFNSAPRIFDTANYIQVRVENGERGWVKTGTFPENVHLGNEWINKDNVREGQRVIPIQTSIRREALAGFEAAYQWQKFRAMAVSCADHIGAQLAIEWGNLAAKKYKDGENMRSRKDAAYPFFVQMLPDTRLEEGPTALKSFYRPGALEGALALELEQATTRNFGSNEGESRPIYLMRGSPIEITKTDQGYDAVMKFMVQIHGYFPKGDGEIEPLKLAVQEQLQKHYTLTAEDPTTYNMTFVLRDAHLVDQAIRTGAKDTELHKFAKRLGNDLLLTEQALGTWHKGMPGLKAQYDEMVSSARATYFNGLGERLVPPS
ncbi:MAG: hypothetical protein WCV90_07070 [Candidatus Woesearchaeota archaeon]|jgi:hypothetical protein